MNFNFLIKINEIDSDRYILYESRGLDMRVLLVEDDVAVIEVVRQALVNQHYLVDVAADGQAGWEFADAIAYDLILLDLMLPRLDGLHFCRQLRSVHPAFEQPINGQTPILLITAQTNSLDKVAALDAGADDYLVKPFDLNELLARVRALLRRGSSLRSPLLKWGAVQLNPTTCEVAIAEQPIHLSAKEYRLLEVLLRAPKRIFSYSDLIDQLWAAEIPTENAVRAQIKGLRKKLKEAGSGEIIETVYGLGYRLRKVEENQQSVAHALFTRHRAGYCERLAMIEQAVVALRQQSLSQEVRHRACWEAHTLKGSLGLFEMDEASRLAGEIEYLLQHALTGSSIELLEYRIRRLKEFLASDQERSLEGNPAVLIQGRGVSEERGATAQNQSPTLWILGNTHPRMEEFIRVATAYPLQVKRINTSEEIGDFLPGEPAAHPITDTSPAAILLLLATPAAPENWAILQNLTAHYPTTPLFVVAASTATQPTDPLQHRLKVAQSGVKSFWQGDIEPSAILQTMMQTIQPAMETPARILVVDDDPAMLAIVQTILKPWGFELTLLNDPQQFWDRLEQAQPDLVILDIAMPEVSGIELCQVIRQDGQWGELPVLFLSAHTDDATLQTIFMVGADDYIRKPVRAVELVSRILRRLEQARLLKRLHQLRL